MKIAVTIGDIAGIGPEVALRALAAHPSVDFLVVGPADIVQLAAARFGVSIDRLKLVDTGALESGLLFSGRDSPETGRASHEAVVRAIRLALSREVDAIVTAPISKKAWSLAGFADPGHTELIGRETVSDRFVGARPVMAFSGETSSGETIRLALVTIHEPLSAVAALVTRDRVLEAIRIVNTDLRKRFGCECPRIGVAGLNPHAGEAGRIGNEEIDAIAPALKMARAEGIEVEGPIPGDALFLERTRRRFDLLVAMYHDQGLAAFKALTSGSGVNVTLGLPIIRTSPDHGTAYEIAGKGVADASSMRAAIHLAVKLVERSCDDYSTVRDRPSH